MIGFKVLGSGLGQALHYLRSQLTINTQSDDLKEGIAAFMEKRKPKWKGR
jgi:enoyl-CoA hydratase/carnithine racemase